MKNSKNQSGSTLIEILIASVVFSIVLLAFISALSTFGIIQIKTKLRSEGILLSKEYMEIAYNLSLQNWDAFYSLNDTYTIQIRDTPDFNNIFPYYTFSPGLETIADTYTRSIEISSVYRDDQGKISDNVNGQLDPQTKKIKVTTSIIPIDTIEPLVYETYLINFGNL